MVTIEIVC